MMIASMFLSSCSTSNVNPIESLAQVRAQRARIVVVCPSRGVESIIELNNDPKTRSRLVPGGSLVFDATPGINQVKATLEHPPISGSFLRNELEVTIAPPPGSEVFLSVDHFGNWETGRMNSQVYSSASIPLSSQHSGVRLIQVSKEVAAKIAIF